MAGAHNSVAAAPIQMFRRLMRLWSGIALGAVIEPFQNKGWHRSATLAVETAASHFSGNHLAAVWQVGEAPALILMHAKFSIGLDGHKPHKHARSAVQRHDHRPAALGGHARKLRATVWRTETNKHLPGWPHGVAPRFAGSKRSAPWLCFLFRDGTNLTSDQEQKHFSNCEIRSESPAPSIDTGQ